MKNKFTLRILFLVLAVSIFPSCKKFLNVSPGSDLIQTQFVFTSESQVLSAVVGVYATFRDNNFYLINGGLSLYTGLASDELFASNPTSTTDPFYLNELLPSNGTVNNSFYSHPYKSIYSINAIIEGINSSTTLSKSTKDSYVGEMLFTRALIYFYLTNLFGEVPLITGTDFETNSSIPRVSKQQIIELIKADLIAAKSLMSVNYPSSGKARPNKWAAATLLARVYLFDSEWEKAEIESTSVIDSGQYSLVPSNNISSVFLKSSSETIWEIASPNELSPTGDGSFFNPSNTTVRPSYCLTPDLLAQFEAGDLRRTNWVAKNTVSGVDYWYPKKYKQKTISSGSVPTEYQVVLRLAEPILIRAEARARLGNISSAISDLNQIRSRAGLTALTPGSQESAVKAVDKESRTEFFCEQGHRWLDLKRTNQVDSIISALKPLTWQTTDALWPIPESELNRNPNLTQNPGY